MRRTIVLFAFCCWLGAFLTAGCKDRGKAGPDGSLDGGEAEFASLRITDDANHFLFTYLLADGSFQTVEKIPDVPEAARNQVIVMDTALSPEKRQSGSILYVADLTGKRVDGTYPYTIVSRFKFERDLLREPAKSSGVLPPDCAGLAPSPSDHVILYSTSWCSVCKAAAAFMTREKIPFEEKDVEKDAKAQTEVSCKALKTGTRVNGVPVLDIGGTLLLGFDRDQIVKLAEKLKAGQPLSPGASPGSAPAPLPVPGKAQTL